MPVILTLPSDSSMEYFPDNTISRYRVHLPQELEFDGNYEVGLTQFQYPRTWFNVPDYLTDVKLVVYETSAPPSHVKMCQIPRGHYACADALIVALNDAIYVGLNELFDGFERLSYFTFDPLRKTVTYSSHHADVAFNLVLGLKAELLQRLGFVHSEYPAKKRLFIRDNDTGTAVVDLDGGFKNIYINSDICKPCRVVGHTVQSLLRTVPIQGSVGDMILYEPVTIDWLPLRLNRFRHVEIYLTDDLGRAVRFESGKAIVTVHIRRARALDG